MFGQPRNVFIDDQNTSLLQVADDSAKEIGRSVRKITAPQDFESQSPRQRFGCMMRADVSHKVLFQLRER